MLRRLVLLGAVLFLARSAPVDRTEILRYEFEPNIGDGTYKFRYISSNGIEREEIGTTKLDRENKEYIAIKGYYRFYTDKGRMLVKYEADENGYKQTMQEDLKLINPELH